MLGPFSFWCDELDVERTPERGKEIVRVVSLCQWINGYAPIAYS
jgi:hypothetical protein